VSHNQHHFKAFGMKYKLQVKSRAWTSAGDELPDADRNEGLDSVAAGGGGGGCSSR